MVMRTTLFCLLVLVVLCSAIPNTVENTVDFEDACIPWKGLIHRAVLTASVSYLADNPRNDEKPLDPHSIDPLTPSQLFKAYYGEGASSSDYKSAILDIVYSTPHNKAKEDRIRLRRRLYRLAKAGSSELSRKTMGTILLSVVGDFAGAGSDWTESQCFPVPALDNAYNAIAVEFARLRNEVGESLFGHFLGIGLGSTLAFVIDDTGSMSGEISAAKRRVEIIIDHLQNTLDRPQDFVLVPFNDPNVGPLTVTKDAATFKGALAKLHAHGGGDQPENCMGGIQLAIEASRPGSTLYVITDADAKDYKLQKNMQKYPLAIRGLAGLKANREPKDSVVAEAKRKNIVIVFMLTNNLGYCKRARDSRYKKCFTLYQHIANETGGTTLVVQKHTIFEATRIVQTGIKQGLVVVKKIKITDRADGRIIFPVDRSISEVILEAQGKCGSLELHSSGNVEARAIAVGDLFSASLPVAHSYGEWWVAVTGSNLDCDVKILAKSTLGFILTLITKQPEEEESAYKILNGNPSPSNTLGFVIDGYGLKANLPIPENYETKVRFLDESGNDVVDEKKNFFDVHTMRHSDDVPPFYVVVEGTDMEGGRFSRVIPRLIATSHVKITCNLEHVTFLPGSSVSVNVMVTNNGTNDTFVFGVSDTKNFASTRGSTSQFIATNETRIFSVRLFAGANTKDGTASLLTITARGNEEGSFQYEGCSVVVGQKKRPRVDSLSIKGIINSRFAETVVTSVVVNNADVGREAVFDVMLPIDAFIVNLTMKLENETIVGVVDEKKKAKAIFEAAKKSGKAAGHVAARDSSTRVFKTSLFVEPRKNVTFQLTYQQLLRRVRGRYKYGLTISPDQPVKRLVVDVRIVENERLQFVTVPPFKTEQFNQIGADQPAGTTVTFGRDRRSSHIRYAPTITQQTEFSPFGLSGTFEIQYDVDRTQMYGDVTVANGYFAHFFAPPSLPAMPKLVIFLIDASGSMFGYKMAQVRGALTSALNGLNKNDYFNLVFFNDEATPWIRYIMSPASPASIRDAIEVMSDVQPTGGTNILDAFETAFDIMQPFLPELPPEDENSTETETSGEEPIPEHYSRIRRLAAVTQANVENYAKMIVFLTDGSPSVGVTDPKEISASVERLNRGRMKINTLGFGSLADMKLLKKIAALNGGTSRRVFEELDAEAQIRDYIDEVTNPLMTDVSITYPLDRVDDVTGNTFSVFTAGSELVLAGKIRTDEDLLDGGEDFELERPPRTIHAQVRGRTFENDLELDFDVDSTSDSTNIMTSQHKIKNFTERMWAFLRIKDFLAQASLSDNETEISLLKQEALNMSLKFNFVTPLTSLVVIRPEDRKRIEKQLKKEEEDRRRQEEEERLREEEEERRRLEEEEAERRRVEEEEMRRIEAVKDLLRKDGGFIHSSGRVLSRPGPVAYDTSLRGGAYGDPHLIIPLTRDLNLCFNWDGEEGEIYNLLHDHVTGMTVNGQLITSPAPEGSTKQHRTYISTLAIIIPSKDFKIIVRPNDVTLLPRGSRKSSLPVTSPMTFSRDGITMRIYDVTRRTARITISSDGLTFIVVLNRNNRHRHQADHLDFSVSSNEQHLGSQVSGVIGQFLNADVTLEGDDDADSRFIKINDRSGRVVRFERQQPGTRKRVTCWHSHNNARDIIQGTHEHYLVDDMMSIPIFSFI